MKQGWEIKKLGEVFDLQMGKTPSRDNGDYWGGDNVWVAISDLQDKYIGESKEHITDKALTETKIKKVKAGTTIMSFKLSVGRAAITTQDLYTNEAIMAFNLNEGYDLIADYIYYYLKGYKWQGANKAVMGLTLNKASISQNHIAIPPREEQERIVAELDCLSGVIEKKREQLKQLDALAQSIFYQMFGDPITNEKSWETCELQKVSTLLNGRAYKQNELLDEGKYKVLRVGNFFTNSNYYYSDLELEPEKYCDDGDLLFAWSASFGAFIWNGGKVIYHYHIWKVLYDKQKLNIDYYRFLLNTMTAYFMKDVHGIGMVHLTKAGMEQYILPIPPLALQQEFADKIEAIEKQKELIKQSITQTEELFNSRMSYYFN